MMTSDYDVATTLVTMSEQPVLFHSTNPIYLPRWTHSNPPPLNEKYVWLGVLCKITKMLWDRYCISTRTIAIVLKKAMECASEDNRSKVKALQNALDQGIDGWIVRMKTAFLMEMELGHTIVSEEVRTSYYAYTNELVQRLI
jgi:hypothetical protein